MNEAHRLELVRVTWSRRLGQTCKSRLQQEALSKGTAPEAVSRTLSGDKERQEHTTQQWPWERDSTTMAYLMSTG